MSNIGTRLTYRDLHETGGGVQGPDSNIRGGTNCERAGSV